MSAIFWRIAVEASAYSADDLSGKGAELTGGRWNAQGTPMIYIASSRAMAYLETVVHLDGSLPLPLNRYLVKIEIPDDLWASADVFDPANHVGWDALPAGRTSIGFGTNWAASRVSLLLRVPSVVIPEEFNVLVNPRHTDISKVASSKIRRWTYDQRTRL